MRRLNKNDWSFFIRTAGWSIMVCQALSLIAVAAAALVWILMPMVGWFLVWPCAVFVGLCQAGMVSSLLTGLLRRNVLEKGRADDANEGWGTYMINVTVLFALVAVGGAVQSWESPAKYWEFVLLVAASVTVGSLVASPLLIPAVDKSQRYMSNLAKRYPRSTHA